MEEKKIGLWEKTDKNGEKYWSGRLDEKQTISMFKNKYKQEGDNKPTFNILLRDSIKKEIPQVKEIQEEIPF